MRKVILPVILIIIISCENKIVQEESNTTIDTARINQPKTAQINQNIVDQPKSISDSRYSFVVLWVKILYPEMKNSCYRNL